jgi:hypothetical protein
MSRPGAAPRLSALTVTTGSGTAMANAIDNMPTKPSRRPRTVASGDASNSAGLGLRPKSWRRLNYWALPISCILATSFSNGADEILLGPWYGSAIQ